MKFIDDNQLRNQHKLFIFYQSSRYKDFNWVRGKSLLIHIVSYIHYQLYRLLIFN